MPPANLADVLKDLRQQLDTDTSLRALAERSGWSMFHLHRQFREAVGETPKQYALRLRLERAAARLVSTQDSVIDTAFAVGFNSHEVFSRAFRRHFGRPPAAYRAVALEGSSKTERARHAAITETTGACVNLFYRSLDHHLRRSQMTVPTVERREIAAQPVLFVRQHVARPEISTAIGECLGKVFPFCMKAGLALAGPPFTRYPSMGMGIATIESGMPLAAAASGEGDIEFGTLAGGPVAFAVHTGPYDRLVETYAVVERWIEAQGLKPAGAPWESYVTDPADYPDPADWRTEVFWPLSK